MATTVRRTGVSVAFVIKCRFPQGSTRMARFSVLARIRSVTLSISGYSVMAVKSSSYSSGMLDPRAVVLIHNNIEYPLFHIKGEHGDNRTFTRLGNIAPINNDSTYRYIALFVTETSEAVGDCDICGPRNLAIVRANRSDYSVDPSLPNTLTVTSNGVRQTNRLKWLTHYSASQNLHAEEP